jgi:hypothetical protein
MTPLREIPEGIISWAIRDLEYMLQRHLRYFRSRAKPFFHIEIFCCCNIDFHIHYWWRHGSLIGVIKTCSSIIFRTSCWVLSGVFRSMQGICTLLVRTCICHSYLTPIRSEWPKNLRVFLNLVLHAIFGVLCVEHLGLYVCMCMKRAYRKERVTVFLPSYRLRRKTVA